MNKLLDKTRAGGALVLTMVLGMVASLFSPAAMAAAIDVEDVVTDIGAQLVPIASIAGAVLLVFVALKAWKWIRRALS